MISSDEDEKGNNAQHKSASESPSSDFSSSHLLAAQLTCSSPLPSSSEADSVPLHKESDSFSTTPEFSAPTLLELQSEKPYEKKEKKS